VPLSCDRTDAEETPQCRFPNASTIANQNNRQNGEIKINARSAERLSGGGIVLSGFSLRREASVPFLRLPIFYLLRLGDQFGDRPHRRAAIAITQTL
jgi:hypothetical protein